MAIDTAAGLAEALRQFRLLEPAQLTELAALQARAADPRALAKALIQRAWLTPCQVNQLLQGRGADLVLGSYVVLERLGEGGMGQVFKARHQKLGRVVALKVIRKDRLTNAEARKRFHREIQAVSQLSHPNVVMAFDADHAGDQHFFAMEYVEGTDLSKWVKEHGPMPVREACVCIHEAALGLQHAYEKGLVHRDIKPSNLILTAEALKGGAGKGPRIKLMDMGLVSLQSADDEGASTLTQEGSVVGTPDFIAPEQARNAKRVDIRADLYSLGCTLYFLLTGQPPFGGGTLTEKLLKHHWDAATPVEQLRPDVPPAVAAVVTRLMAKKPEERYQTPAELAAALAAVLDPKSAALTGRVPQAVPLASPVRATVAARGGSSTELLNGSAPPAPRPRPARKRWLLVGGAGGAFLGLLLVAALVVGSKPSAPRDTREQAGNTGESPKNLGPLDRLRAADIPEAELVAAGGGDPKQAPPGLVAVLGDSRLKHWNEVGFVTFSPDGKVLATAAADGTAGIWDAVTGRLLRSFAGHAGQYVMQVAFADNGKRLVTFGQDRAVTNWDARSGKRLGSFQVPDASLALAFSPDGSRTAVAATRNLVSVRETASGNELRSFRCPPAIHRLAFSGDGKALAAACIDGSVHVWDPTRDGDAEVLATRQGFLNAVAFSPSGKMLATASNKDGTIKVWEWPARKEVQALTPDKPAVFHSLAFSPNSDVLAAGMASSAVQLWDVAGGRALRPLNGHSLQVYSVAFSPDGKTLASASQDWQLKLWDVEAGRELPSAQATPGSFCVALSPDGKSVAWGGRDNVVHVWDVAARREAHALRGARGLVWVLAFSPNSKTLAAADNTGTVNLWDLAGARAPLSFHAHATAARGLAFSPDGKTLITAGGDNNVKFWDAATGRPQGSPVGSNNPFFALALSHDGKTLAAGGAGGPAVWELPQLAARPLNGNQRDVFGLAFSPDDKVLASASSDGSLKLWDLGRGTEPLSFSQERPFSSVAFSPGGDALAAAVHAGKVVFHDPRRRTAGSDLVIGPPFGSVMQVAYSPEGRHIATANGNGTVYLLRLPEKR